MWLLLPYDEGADNVSGMVPLEHDEKTIVSQTSKLKGAEPRWVRCVVFYRKNQSESSSGTACSGGLLL
jgi:hypothetical protein